MSDAARDGLIVLGRQAIGRMLRPAVPDATVFATMFALESIARALLVTIIPLQAYAILQEPRSVSIAFFAVGVTGLLGSLLIPLLIASIRRRWVYTLGAGLLMAAPVLFLSYSIAGQIGGMLVRVLGAACLNITLSLYIMDWIAKRDLVKSEPRKFLYSATAWVIGPSLGVFLYESIAHSAAFAVSAFCALILLINFWRLRLQDNPAVAAATRKPPNPIAGIGRFVVQKRLMLGWFIAFTRTVLWGTFMVYGPLMLVRAGYNPLWGAILVSSSSALLLLSPLWGRIGARVGLRRIIVFAFLLSGVSLLAAGATMGTPILSAVFLMLATLGGTMLDAVGNIPFMRAVRPYERPQMTTVYRTYLDMGDLLSSLAYAALLTIFPLPVVFLSSGLFMFVAAWVARYIPKGM